MTRGAQTHQLHFVQDLVFCLVKAALRSRWAPQLAAAWEEAVTHHQGYGAHAAPGSVHGGHGAPAIRVDVVALHVAEARVVIQPPDGVNGAAQGRQGDASPRETQHQHLSAHPEPEGATQQVLWYLNGTCFKLGGKE